MKGMGFNGLKIISIVLGAMLVLGIVTYYGLTGEKTYLDYTYTTVTNDTITNLADGTNATHNKTFTLGRDISGETAESYLTVNVNNTNTTANATITVYLNGGSMGSYTALNGTVTAHNFTTYVQSQLVTGENTVLYVSDLATPTQTVTETAFIYNSGTEDVGNTPTNNILINVVLVLSIIVFVTSSILGYLGIKKV